MSNLKIGIIGLGWFGRHHLDAWTQCTDAEVTAICDPALAELDTNDEAGQDAFHNTAGDEISLDIRGHECFESVDDFFAHGDFDLVDIATPESLHASHIGMALEASKNLIVEKPYTTSASDARRLAWLSHDLRRNIYVGNILRFDPRYVEAIRQLREANE